MKNRFAYVCIWGGGHLAKLDLTSLQVGDENGVRQIAKIELAQDANPYSLNIEPSGRFAFVACNATDHVPVIDLTKDEVYQRVVVDCDDGMCGARAVAFSADGKTAFVSLERTNAIAAISIDNLSVIRYIQTGGSPRGIVQDSDIIVIANFARDAGAPLVINSQVLKFMPHSVTFVDLNGVDLGGDIPIAKYAQIRVGHGPCSVSMFDPEKAANHFEVSEAKSVVA